MKNNMYQNAIEQIRAAKQKKEVRIDSQPVIGYCVRNSNLDIPNGCEAVDFLLDQYAKSVVCSALNAEHCYSAERGSGMYINVDACMDVGILRQLLGFVTKDENGDKARGIYITRRLAELETIANQFVIDYQNQGRTDRTVGDMLQSAGAM